MSSCRASLPILVLTVACSVPAAEAPYFPGPGAAWEHRSPAQVGMDSTALANAMAYAAAESFAARGGGSNVIWIDPTNDLVAVVRWINGAAVNGFLERVLAAVQDHTGTRP